jgi:hypothetical protein
MLFAQKPYYFLTTQYQGIIRPEAGIGLSNASSKSVKCNDAIAMMQAPEGPDLLTHDVLSCKL